MQKKIADFPGYFVHSDGYVVSYKSGIAKVLLGGNRGQYKSVLLCKNGKMHNRSIHRLVACAFVENPENLPQVNHKDGDKTNNCATNLEWVTSSQNLKHAVKMGLLARPTESHRRKMEEGCGRSMAFFTLEEGSEIMEMKDALGMSCREIANLAGCSKTLIQRLALGKIRNFKDGSIPKPFTEPFVV